MKTIKLISALALTLGLAACENFDLPNPPGQSYPNPDGYFENSDLVLVATGSPINLVEDNAANRNVTVATIQELKNFPEGYTLAIDMQVGKDADFSKSTVLATEIQGNDVQVNPDFINGAIQEVLTKQPGVYEIPVRFMAYAELGTTRMGLGGIGATYGNGTLNVKTLDPAKIIEDSYYLIPCSADGTPDFAKALKMNNTKGEGLSGYDSPEFAVQIEVPETEEYIFKIASASVYEAKDAEALLGCNIAADGLGGKLGTEYGAGTVTLKGSVLITINAEIDSVTFNYAFANIFPVTGSTKIENTMWLYTDNYISYYGVTAINQKWTIFTQPDKSGVKFSVNPDVEPVVSEDGFEQSGEIMLSTGSATISAPVKRNCLYYVDVNLVQNTYTLKALTTLGLVGEHNGWDEKNSIELTPSKDLKTWTATDVELKGEFKINANGAWEYDFGGVSVATSNGTHVYNLNFKGGNMSVEDGTYDVTVNFSTMPYVLTLVKK